MDWFNWIGLIYVAVIMVPNIVFAVKCKDGFNNSWKNKAVEIIEQIGRFGCMGFMIFNIPNTWFGFWFDEAFAVYVAINSVLVGAYCIIWIICWKKNNMFKALSLSIIPATIFLFSAIMLRSILLGVTALLFAPTHILISYKNAKTDNP